MKSFFKSIFCAVLIFTYNSMSGQDKIITINNDTIECKILSISSTHLNYEQTNGNYTVGKFIPVSDVLEYYKGVAKQNKNTQDVSKPDKIQYQRPNFPPFKHWQFGVKFGGSYITASSVNSENDLYSIGIPIEEARKYYDKLKSGIHFDANFHYLFNEFGGIVNMGIGLKYRLSSFSSNIDVMQSQSYILSPYLYHQFTESEKMYINYLGTSYIVQIWLDRRHKFKIAVENSLGYVHYRDEARFSSIMSNNLLATGHTFGADSEIDFAYYPLNYLSVNANINYFAAVFRRLTIHNANTVTTVKLDKENYENVSHLNYSIGIQFHF